MWRRRTSSTQFKHVFIITYGRSGSTLLAGILNSIDGYVIRGENHNFLFPLFRSYRAIENSVRDHGGPQADSPTDPWWGVNEIDPRDYKAQIREIVTGMLLGQHKGRTRVLGFKEIRYPWASDQGELANYLDFMADLFPDTAFIFNYRDLDAVLKSKWWAEASEEQRSENRRMLEKFELESRKYIKANPARCFEISYEDILAGPDRTRELFAFLGESFDEESFRRTLDTRHSY